MLKFVIVDDEPLALESFAELLDWEKYGFSLAGCAANGAQALQLVQDKQPEIVFTDIRMPIMDGLELCRRLHEEHPDVKVVILTAYRDFEYARRALSYGVTEYLLKNQIEPETVLPLLKRMQEEIEQERRRKEAQKHHYYQSMMLNMVPPDTQAPGEKNRPCCCMLVQCRRPYIAEHLGIAPMPDVSLRKKEAEALLPPDSPLIVQQLIWLDARSWGILLAERGRDVLDFSRLEKPLREFWDALQSDYNCIYMIANMHAITVRQTPADLRRQTREAAALLLACGIDPDRSVLFVQSHVPAHAELSWVLSCSTPFGELTRMHQFKEKSARHPEDINAGLFTYPVLMAADILIYNADLVPVGIDQKQHLELARNVAQRFNGVYGDTFVVPDGYIPKTGAKIMSLQEPEKKMSKSDTNVNGFVLMLDDADTIVRKFKRAVTDSDGCVRAAGDKPGVTNLMSIYSVFTGRDYAAIEKEFAGRGYGEFKLAVAEVVKDAFAPIQAEYKRILADKAYLDGVLTGGARRAAAIADRTVTKVYKKVGFLQI